MVFENQLSAFQKGLKREMAAYERANGPENKKRRVMSSDATANVVRSYLKEDNVVIEKGFGNDVKLSFIKKEAYEVQKQAMRSACLLYKVLSW